MVSGQTSVLHFFRWFYYDKLLKCLKIRGDDKEVILQCCRLCHTSLMRKQEAAAVSDLTGQ